MKRTPRSSARARGRRAAAGVVALVLVLAAACEDTPPQIVAPAETLPAPDAPRVVSGDGTITVDWTWPADADFAQFAVWRSDDERATWRRVATVTTPPWTDVSLRAGQVVWYRVAGIDATGREGPRSPATLAVASVYAVLVEQADSVTASRDVTLSFTAPATTQFVQVADDSSFTGAPWRPFAPTLAWRLGPGDGLKRVYARFIDEAGNRTATFSDAIVLDTFAEVSLVTVTCQSGCVSGDTISPGATIHLHVETTGAERDGRVDVFIEGMGESPVAIVDEGRLGDVAAGDGVYERDFTFPQFFRQRTMRVSAAFTDAAGNVSPEVESASTLVMSDPLAPVFLFPAEDSTATSVTLRWTRVDDAHFARYEVYRSRSPGVDAVASVLAGQVTAASTNTFTDTGVADSTTYWYRVFVVNDLDERAASNERSVTTRAAPAGP